MTGNRLTGWWERAEASTAQAAPAVGAFVVCPPPLAMPGGWQYEVYRAAYEQAQAVVRPLPPVLAGVVSVN